jgi:two-component system, OmpR family, phosphate regulon sensor histidine kinase PhoR
MSQATVSGYWLPVIGRLLVISLVSLVIGYAVSPVSGWAAAALGCLLYAVSFAVSVYRTQRWINSDTLLGELPDSPQFSSLASWLYRARRREQSVRAAMDQTLAKFQSTLASLPDGVVLVDAAMNIQWCNPMAERHLGIDLRRDSGLRLTNLVREPAFVNAMLQAEPGEPVRISVGQPARSLRVSSIRFETDERLIVTSDVSEADRLDQVRRDFIANVSHELRTPLTVVSGFLELANSATPMAAEHLALMRAESGRMRRLIDDLLTLSKLDSADTVAEDDEVDLQSLVNRALDSARALSGGRHQFELREALPKVKVKGSASELESALGNLLSNAVRYTPASGKIGLACRLDDNGLSIEVQDSGPGIASEHIPRLTERFYRIDKSRSRETGGTGLGLAIVKHVILRHQGRMEVHSELGHGSTFALLLPRQRIIINT